MADDNVQKYASRAGAKLAHALVQFRISVQGAVCADLGCSTGGFTDCLLQEGATKVYAVDTAYGVLDWKLRNDPRVVVMERTNAMHVALPELVDFVCVDTSWTKQRLVVPHALTLLRSGGNLVSLIKPHYEAEPQQRSKGVVKEEALSAVVDTVRHSLAELGIAVEAVVESPILGGKGKNREFLVWIKKP